MIDDQDAKRFREILAEQGLDPQPYSGRGMYGKECVGVSLERTNEIWNVALMLCNDEHFDPNIPGPPDVDSQGRGVVAYWPGARWVR